jgi:uncharacterized membrane protein
MAAIFQSLGRTIAAGIVLLIVILAIAAGTTGSVVNVGAHEWWRFVFRWFHVMCGVMWVGLLWYFNFVQTPSMPKIPDAEKPAVTKVIAPTALFWFRHAALWTVITGLTLAGMSGYLWPALTFTKGVHTIGLGMWIALIMAFNVWFIIWPSQQKALGLVQVDPDTKAKAARLAGLTSRFNTMLSIPMLYCMVAQQNGGL